MMSPRRQKWNDIRFKEEEQVEVAGGFTVVKSSHDSHSVFLLIPLTETKAMAVQTKKGFSHAFLPHDLSHAFGSGGMLLDRSVSKRV
jgi:hypothetical protein